MALGLIKANRLKHVIAVVALAGGTTGVLGIGVPRTALASSTSSSLTGVDSASSTACKGSDSGAVAPTGLQVAGADTTTPVLSGIVSSSLGTGLVTGQIYLEDSAGNPIGGSPTAAGTVLSGSRVTWQVPPGVLSLGETYRWWMSSPRGCVDEPSAVQSFTLSSPRVSAASAAESSVTIAGSALEARTAIADPAGCSHAACPVVTTGWMRVGSDGANSWVASWNADLYAIPPGEARHAATMR